MSRRRNTEPDPEPQPLTSQEMDSFVGWHVGAEDIEALPEPEAGDERTALDELAEELFREYHATHPPKP